MLVINVLETVGLQLVQCALNLTLRVKDRCTLNASLNINNNDNRMHNICRHFPNNVIDLCTTLTTMTFTKNALRIIYAGIIHIYTCSQQSIFCNKCSDIMPLFPSMSHLVLTRVIAYQSPHFPNWSHLDY